MKKVRVLRLTEEQEAALKYTLEAALLTRDVAIARNVVLFDQMIQSAPFEDVAVPEVKKENGQPSNTQKQKA